MRTADETTALLYGADPAEGLVGLHLVREAAHSPARMRLYWRRSPALVEPETVPFYPFFFLQDIAFLDGFSRTRYKAQRLVGTGSYAYLVVFTTLRAYRDALRHIERTTTTAPRQAPAVYTAGSPEQQYLMQSGRTLFKGMSLEDVHRLQLDLEVYAPDHFPDPERDDHPILIAALSDNRGWTRLIHTRHLTERELLAETAEAIRTLDPDVLEGHNIYGFDLPYLLTRARRLKVPMPLGRDGSEPRTYPAAMRFAERSIDYQATDLAGRHVLDTLFQVMAYDVFKRDLPNYTLKTAARYFNLSQVDRVYVDGADIASTWDTDPDRLLAYALDDVRETERLARHLSGSSFYLTQMVPMPYGTVARTGPAAKIEGLFVREYLRTRSALPQATLGNQTIGGYTDIFLTGVLGPIVYADVESLYPSIMLRYGVQPATDTQGVFLKLLQQLTTLRLSTKARMNAADNPLLRSELDARQSAFKIVINSFYGYLGYQLGLFNDFPEAERVARIGQDLLRQLMGEIQTQGGQVVEVDTDGVLFIPPPEVRGEAAERAFVSALSAHLPDGINVGFDGRFERMLSYKKKNYALLGYDGSLTFKGSSLVSRSVERFGREVVREAIRLLLQEDVAGLHALYRTWRRRIQAHAWPDGIEAFVRTETLKSTPDRYLADVAAGRRTRAAAYELALQHAQQTGRPFRVGDRVRYYIAGSGTGQPGFEQAKRAETWTADAPDENTAYYLGRLDQFVARFEVFFETSHSFREVFGEEDLFGFDAAAHRLAVRAVERGDAAPLPF